MKALTLLITYLCFSIFAQAGEKESPKDFVLRWVEAYNKNDAKHIGSFYEKSDLVECLVSAGLTRKGHEAITKMYADDIKTHSFL